MCFKSYLIQGKPYPCREARFRGRESVADRAGDGFAICIAHGRKRGMATVMIWFNAGHGRNLSVPTNSPHPRSVHVHNHVHGQSVNSDWQLIQLSMNRQRQPSWIVRSQSAVVNFPRTRIGHGHDLSAVADRLRIVTSPASPCPHRCQPIFRFISDQFQSMTTFDPVEVRKAVAEFTPRRAQKFQMVEKSLPAVTNARIVPLCFTSRALVTSLHFQDSNKIGGLPSALVGGRCAPAPLAPAHRPQTEVSGNQQRVALQDVKWVAHLSNTGSSHTRTNLPSGFVNCAADDTAPFRLARTLRNRLKNAPFRSSLPIRTALGEILASRKNRVLTKGSACLDQFPFFAAHLRLSWV